MLHTVVKLEGNWYECRTGKWHYTVIPSTRWLYSYVAKISTLCGKLIFVTPNDSCVVPRRNYRCKTCEEKRYLLSRKLHRKGGRQ